MYKGVEDGVAMIANQPSNCAYAEVELCRKSPEIPGRWGCQSNFHSSELVTLQECLSTRQRPRVTKDSTTCRIYGDEVISILDDVPSILDGI